MSWFKRDRKAIESFADEDRRVLTEGLWIKCEGCREPVWKKDLEANVNVCPKCGFHYKITAYERIDLLLDEGWHEFDNTLRSTDPLKFKAAKAYKESIDALPARVGVRDAVVNAEGNLNGTRVVVSAMEYNFIGGSMGSVVGEKITRSVERALKENRPLIVVSCSGGARMQEGALSLMQMAKISAALALLDRKAVPYISILTNPTTGGVTASFAMLGDLNIAEPKALIGFAGPRVIESTVRVTLPEGFQRAEFLQTKGAIDFICDRRELRKTVASTLAMLLRLPADAVL
jgi:acetyl-CoA carboxylase carboxyl transferase subunit beta